MTFSPLSSGNSNFKFCGTLRLVAVEKLWLSDQYRVRTVVSVSRAWPINVDV